MDSVQCWPGAVFFTPAGQARAQHTAGSLPFRFSLFAALLRKSDLRSVLDSSSGMLRTEAISVCKRSAPVDLLS